MAVYTFKKRDNGEIHIFEGEMFLRVRCTTNEYSVCGAVERSDADDIANSHNCLTENATRTKAAEIGRDVCGNCIKEFYTT